MSAQPGPWMRTMLVPAGLALAALAVGTSTPVEARAGPGWGASYRESNPERRGGGHNWFGEHGRGSDQYGKSATDVVLRVPVGTVVSDLESGALIADLDHDGSRALLAAGGAGGRGNLHFKSSTNRAPRQFTRGAPGEHRRLKLELKLLADVGLLGMPNAGKSTLIRAVSAARPRVADYPFTTLSPSLGVVRVDVNRGFVLADIPGLIEGAAEGAGLGHQFLRHLARTRLLLHLVDIAPLDAATDPVHEARAIVKELRRYDEALYRKPRWVVLNKIDLVPAEERERTVQRFLRGFGWRGKSFIISALTGEGCRELAFAIMEHLEQDSGAGGRASAIPQAKRRGNQP